MLRVAAHLEAELFGHLLTTPLQAREVLRARGVVRHADGHETRELQVGALRVHVAAEAQALLRVDAEFALLTTGVHLHRMARCTSGHLASRLCLG